MMDHYQFVATSSDQYSLKVLDPDRQPSNMLCRASIIDHVNALVPLMISGASIVTAKTFGTKDQVCHPAQEFNKQNSLPVCAIGLNSDSSTATDLSSTSVQN